MILSCKTVLSTGSRGSQCPLSQTHGIRDVIQNLDVVFSRTAYLSRKLFIVFYLQIIRDYNTPFYKHTTYETKYNIPM
eukprot:COSAG02_NODE_512_length_20850_cov_4.993302_8_plen_78_part_00